MSWSIHSVNDLTADEAIERIASDKFIPDSIKEYIGDGIEALKKRYGEEVRVSISGSGHLHNGEEGNWDSTTANLTVSRSV